MFICLLLRYIDYDLDLAWFGSTFQFDIHPKIITPVHPNFVNLTCTQFFVVFFKGTLFFCVLL